ncbi:pentatricopeptide repeat-containing protein At4g15720 [Typha latifolia]|uniref:pentatricopeptide repeat-containing protein At4g15720 n=1 Tax=Typha latifolia TaxID=4733 RepID=UPI003C30E1FD
MKPPMSSGKVLLLSAGEKKKKLVSPPALVDLSPYLVRLLRDSRHLDSVSCTHSKILKSGSSATVSVGNYLITAYVRCQTIVNARKMFDEMPETNVVSWTSLMAGYVDAGQPEKAILLFGAMGRFGVEANSYTFATAVNACSHLADLKLGRRIHAKIELFGLRPDVVVSTALIDMYGKSGALTDARKLFDGMVDRNVVSWGSMISAYAQNACGNEALSLFGEFLHRRSLSGLSPNHFMFSSIVNACAIVGRLGMGRSTHCAVIRYGHDRNDVIAGALIDMYSKCGCIAYSRKVFDQIEHCSLIPYTSMIAAAAKYGLARHSFDLLEQMIDEGVRPNSVTLLAILHACSHSGLVDIGLWHLKSMRTNHGIEPCVKHYTCAVDMLGRAGRLDEAYELSKEVRAEGDDALMLWSALLSSSRTHGRLDIAVEAGNRIAEYDRDVAGTYVAMSNTYVSAGQWDGAASVWSEMRRRGIRKEPGCSWVEIKDMAYVFYAGEVSSAGRRAGEVMELLEELEERMRERGYVSRGGHWVFDGVGEGEEEGKGVMVGVHSEKLALGFGLISIPKGVTIRVMKNLRMCKDCHEAFKLISDIVGREIVVRDLNRFHHFRVGSCTCGDYW